MRQLAVAHKDDRVNRGVRETKGEIGPLLAAYATAAALYSAAVQELSELQHNGSHAAILAALDDVDHARRRCEQVRLAVQMCFARK